MSKSKQPKSTGNQETPISKSNPASTGSSENQLTAFEKAMKHFHKREFAAALPLFETASHGAEISVAHAAQMHVRMCRQRLEKDTPQLSTADDNYAYALTLAGKRDLGSAEHYLRRALELAPRADHVLYSLALVKGLQGDIPAAAGFLSRAIEIQPANRTTARTDPEFHELLHHQPIRDLVS